MTDGIEMLNTYLAQARRSLDKDDVGAIVIGNDAADLDSMVSAILFVPRDTCLCCSLSLGC